jgi:hypothetical protein
MALPKMSITVPVRDIQDPLLPMTIASITQQEAIKRCEAKAEVIIVSPQGSVPPFCKELESENVTLLASRDSGAGIYAAVSIGFHQHTGDIHGYLGSGDLLDEGALSLLISTMTNNFSPRVHWLTSAIVTRRPDGAVIRVTQPPRFTRVGLISGAYSRVLPSLQQESTFWTSSLHSQIDHQRFRSFQLAGDYFLWWQFAHVSEPFVTEGMLGSFRWHRDNASSNYGLYLSEVESICGPLSRQARIWALGEKARWLVPNRYKHLVGSSRYLRYSLDSGD